MYKQFFFLLFLSILISNCGKPLESTNQDSNNKTPNIIIIYGDDLGFGDVSSYGATELKTPNFDRIANEGIRFTNGYASSATCTPSRFAMLAGEYPWRNKRARILPGNAPLIFDLQKQTLPSMLKGAGYTTAVVGKWHLGLGDENLDWNGAIKPGPNEIGFDYSYIMASTNDRVPTVYVENHKMVRLEAEDPIEVNYKENFQGEPTGRENPELLKLHPSHGHDMSVHNGISRIGFMKGGKSALWIDEDMADTMLHRSQQFIADNQDNPFFLFYSLHQPHVPRTPHARFVGASGMGPRGDVILEADWAVGQLLNTLDSLGLSENTIIVFSSDNGPVLDDGYEDEAVVKIGNHKAAGPLRGGKYSLFDAGAHVPFMLRWTGTIQPGTSDALVCQMDLLASFANLVGQENKSADSEDILATLLGESKQGRENLVLEATGRTCYREGDWVFIPSHKGRAMTNKWVNIETGNSEEEALYNLKDDIGQQENLASRFPEKIVAMKERFEAIKNGGGE